MAWGSSFDKHLWHIGPNTKEVEVDTDALAKWPNEAADAKLLNDVLMEDGAIQSLPSVEVAEDVFVPYPFAFKELTKEEFQAKYGKHTNKVPTHDPYTNPNAHIYYECNCGQILDPGTKRFAELNNCASRAGWKIRFSDNGYIPYCVECGKGVE